MEQILRKMTLGFFGTGSHKIVPEKFLKKEKALFLDVRSTEEAESISIMLKHHPHIISRHIPINEIPDRMEEIPKDRFVGVFCPAGVRSTMVYTYLLSKGFEFDQVRILEGGYAALTEALKPNKVWEVVQAQ